MIFSIRSKVVVTKDDMSAFDDLISSIMPRMGFGMRSLSSGVYFSYCAVNYIDMIWHFSLGVLTWVPNAMCIEMF